jgi:hypothetical protein
MPLPAKAAICALVSAASAAPVSARVTVSSAVRATVPKAWNCATVSASRSSVASILVMCPLTRDAIWAGVMASRVAPGTVSVDDSRLTRS